MTALPAEVESAIAEGVEMIVLEAPASIEVDERGHCTALITQPQMIGRARRPSGADGGRQADAPHRSRHHPHRRGAGCGVECSRSSA
ncbi:MAG: hypothetical protein ACLR3C_16180 [Eggerthella lenta]